MNEKQEIFTLLNGAVKMHRSKYNPTSDAVWLAASVIGTPKTILDVGIGTGGVSLCLHHHLPDAQITGIDVSPEMLDACQKNAELNNFKITLLNQDILTWSPNTTFDLVVSNPPYFTGTPAHNNPQAHHNTDLIKWTKRCIARVRPRGYFCTIVDASRMSDIIDVLNTNFGDITIFPLFGSKNTAERVIIRCRAGTNGGCVVHSGISMNCEAILRDGLTIQNFLSNIHL